MRQALLINFNVAELAFMRIHIDGFQLEKFAPFVHENNILSIVEELENAMYHIERNGNSKIILTDLSIEQKTLHTLLKNSIKKSFNQKIVDNETKEPSSKKTVSGQPMLRPASTISLNMLKPFPIARSCSSKKR